MVGSDVFSYWNSPLFRGHSFIFGWVYDLQHESTKYSPCPLVWRLSAPSFTLAKLLEVTKKHGISGFHLASNQDFLLGRWSDVVHFYLKRSDQFEQTKVWTKIQAESLQRLKNLHEFVGFQPCTTENRPAGWTANAAARVSVPWTFAVSMIPGETTSWWLQDLLDVVSLMVDMIFGVTFFFWGKISKPVFPHCNKQSLQMWRLQFPIEECVFCWHLFTQGTVSDYDDHFSTIFWWSARVGTLSTTFVLLCFFEAFLTCLLISGPDPRARLAHFQTSMFGCFCRSSPWILKKWWYPPWS